MSAVKTNHLSSLLDEWEPQKDQLDWVLATIIETDGSSYRKPGAIMFINSLGQYFGLLSGGCLEADIMRQARKCWDNGASHVIQYDMRDEDDIAWQLGIGCGGMVRILLQPVTAQNNYLSLLTLRRRLQENQTCFYVQLISESETNNQCMAEPPTDFDDLKSTLLTTAQGQYFVSVQQPVVRLAIFGGGIDAIPLAKMAKQLGWHVTVFDERLGYAKESFFADVDVIIRDKLSALDVAQLKSYPAIVIMNHNVTMDAQALLISQSSNARYIGMLGPWHRTERVFEEAGIDVKELKLPLYNPVGLDLGGELPESIALSMLSEMHATLSGASGNSLSHISNKIPA
ncbi:XdhC family protein [Planctobacterium marinum]|uniref:Xanthine and CO dehydrogenase family maturation factor XdhC/CoxF family protein n=1 Tax=Planctobacterium marinum TaxID=1631968 RepID=A0AA48HLC9_9ALTE|nr:xanthine and CO dehydrogenase family maturation factor XdhC/CoxF family protein [Planctobacterium marinum]